MTSKLWWLIHKDLVVEYRTRQAWPAMLLLGVIVAAVCNVQLELLPEQRPAAVGVLLWLSILFAGLIAIERTCAAEQLDGCWEGLALYPLSPSVIYLAKLAVSFIALAALECLLVPLFVVLADVPLLQSVWAMMLVAALGALGMASVGTLVSALTFGQRQRGAVLSLLALPLLLPVLLAAAEATRLTAEGNLGAEWCRWVQFLGAFAVVFITIGVVLFQFLIEE